MKKQIPFELKIFTGDYMFHHHVRHGAGHGLSCWAALWSLFL